LRGVNARRRVLALDQRREAHHINGVAIREGRKRNGGLINDRLIGDGDARDLTGSRGVGEREAREDQLGGRCPHINANGKKGTSIGHLVFQVRNPGLSLSMDFRQFSGTYGDNWVKAYWQNKVAWAADGSEYLG
jgi:hypothetical protein